MLALLWELGGFSCFLHFWIVFCGEIEIRWGTQVEQQVISGTVSTAHSQVWQQGGWGPPQGTCLHQLGSSRVLVWQEAQLPREGAVPTHITFLFLWSLALPPPPAGAHWRQQCPGHTWRGPMTASRSFPRRRDFWAGNGSSQTGCQLGLGEGEGIPPLGKHLQETIFRGRGPAPKRKKERGDPGFSAHHGGRRAQPFIQEHLVLPSDGNRAAETAKQRDTRGGRQGPRTRSGLLSVRDSRLSPLPTLARKPLP